VARDQKSEIRDQPAQSEHLHTIAPHKWRKEKKPRAPRQKNDPKYIAAARELRDRYLEQINAAPHVLLPPSANGKYDVSRQLEGAPFGGATLNQTPPRHLLNAA
jgi:hypothetical protein